MSDDYLWDKSGKPDPDVEHLENVLGRLRSSPGHAPRPVLTPARARRRVRWAVGWAAAAVILVVMAAIVRMRMPPTPSWTVARVEGAPRVGQWLETSEADRARLSVPSVGELEIDPGSRIGLVEAKRGEQRFSLAYGTLHAVIWAPPGQFHVETPSASATDLGCTYTLQVDAQGFGTLKVTSGWVAFTNRGRESFVPAGAECRTRQGAGPGTPFYEDASPQFREALERFDGDEGDSANRAAALAEVLAEARARDAMTLWHLIPQTEGVLRVAMVDGLARHVPPPSAAVREGALRGDRAALDQWWNQLGLGDADWWRMWEGKAPRS
jgi:FecR protein